MPWPVHISPQPRTSLRPRLREWLRTGRTTSTKFLSWRAAWEMLVLPIATGLITHIIIQALTTEYDNLWLFALAVTLLASVAGLSRLRKQ